MMAFTNNMSKLIDKIERRLGTRPLNLPPELQKPNWAKVIIEDTLTTYSRYMPHKFRYEVITSRDRKGDYYIIDDTVMEGIELLGVRDIAWDDFSPVSSMTGNQPYGMYDFFSNTGWGMEEVGMVQMRANEISLFNNGIYVEFEMPNKLKLKNATNNDVTRGLPSFKIDLLVKHSPNLTTISPTQMETVEKLAIADVASFLYQELKYYDGLETVFANIDLKMNDLQEQANKRDEIEQTLKEGYVSAANQNQPIMYTI
jgi:hypothetical protein